MVALVGTRERPSLAAALQLQAVQWTGEEGELQDKEELEKKQEEEKQEGRGRRRRSRGGEGDLAGGGAGRVVPPQY